MNGASRRPRWGFTLVELLVVIAIIGILIALLLPAVQAAREAARRASCSNNLLQLALALNNYESAHEAFPYGTVDANSPIVNRPQGYHHGWIVRILPYIEQRNAFKATDFSVSVYDPKNAFVRVLNIATLNCPSSYSTGTAAPVTFPPAPAGAAVTAPEDEFELTAGSGGGLTANTAATTNYAGCHHDVEAPIAETNNGAFILNRCLPIEAFSDGLSQTIFLGETIVEAGDLGWMSGTRATLRNTGWGISGGAGGRTVLPWSSTAEAELDALSDGAIPPAAGAPQLVGGFGSSHPGGANFALGDGSVRYITGGIAPGVFQQLGHRADGKLLDTLSAF